MVKIIKKNKKIIAKKIFKKKVFKVLKKKLKAKKNFRKPSHKLERFTGNPIIFPARSTYWESQATFNPTAFANDGKIHILYRAVGLNNISTIGYASSEDGYNLSNRTFKPVFVHKNFPVKNSETIFYYGSGGGWNGGAEDPRITKIDNMLYMTYTAFDGWGSVRIGLTSINLEDFLNKRWNWRDPVLISLPGEIHKNWAVFPEKINGKYAIIHGISPRILVNYFDNLNFDGKTFIKSMSQEEREEAVNRTGVRSMGPAPIKTKYGWLVFYHIIELNDRSRYKLMAMLLDLKDPTKILYKSKKPILEPDAFYENEGYKPGVIYSCGAVVKDGILFIYYGGADMVSCVATANSELFLKDLISIGITRLKKGKNKN